MSKRPVVITQRTLNGPPDSGLSGVTTVEERLQLVATLTREAWTLSGLPIPDYERAKTPVALRRLGADAAPPPRTK